VAICRAAALAEPPSALACQAPATLPHHLPAYLPTCLPAAGALPVTRPLSSWVTALLAVLDSATLILTLSADTAPAGPARLCLRGGFPCFRRMARAT
jgi:hypothetical protein